MSDTVPKEHIAYRSALICTALILGLFAMSKRRKPTHKHEIPAHKENQASGDIQILQTGSPVIPRPPETKQSSSNNEQENPFWKWWLPRLGIIAGIAYAIITWFMYCANRDAATAAQTAATTGSQQLELTERPWIKADIALKGPLTFNVNGGNITLKILMENTGTSPALRTYLQPQTLIGHAGNDAPNYREPTCREADRVISSFPKEGVALFPHVPFEQDETVTFNNEQIKEFSDSALGKHFPSKMLSPAVVLCIAYRPNFKNTIYHTAYILDLYQSVPDNPLSRFFTLGQDVPLKNLQIGLHDTDAIHAD